MKNTRLNLLKYLAIFVTVCIFFSCSKDDTSDNDADYNLLGITSITINNSIIPIKSDGVLFDLSDCKDIATTGMLSEPNKKHVEVDYAILTKDPEASSAQIQSKYSDVSVTIDKISTSTSVKTWIIKITRKGYLESITYKLAFFIQVKSE